VKRVARVDESWLVEWETAQGVESALGGEVILATDPNNAKKILSASFGEETDKLFFPRALSNAIIRLWFDTKPKKSAEAGIFTGDFMIHNYFWLDRLYDPYRKWARETGGSAIEVHVYGPPETLAQPDALLITQAIKDVEQGFPEMRGHRVGAHLQRNAEVHTLPQVGARDAWLGTVSPWKNLFCAGDWVRHPAPAFFLERACLTGIEAANAVLEARGLEKFALTEYLPPEPFVAWIEKLMKKGRERRRARKLGK
jgi:isorenieratene synthase